MQEPIGPRRGLHLLGPAATALLVLASFVPFGGAVTSCSSGPTAPTPTPAPAISCTAVSSNPGPNTISIRCGSIGSGQLTVDVVATQVDNLAAVYFDLVFAPATVRFVSATEGPFFRNGGGTVQFIAEEDMTGSGSGRLVVGVAFVPDSVGVSGTGTIASLTFQSGSTGTTGLSFEASGARLPGGAAAPVSFSGASVRIR